jgi:uncharacterized protein
MDETAQTSCTAFEGDRRIASGTLLDVAMKVKATVDRGEHAPILVFDDATSRQIEIDLRGTSEQVAARLAEGGTADGSPRRGAHGASGDGAPRGPGRPKLGVVAREVTLLPRHWEWLGAQPGGASVALRKLVEEAKRANLERDRVRQAQDAAYRFMSAIAGDRPGFEEATRALFAADARRFEECIGAWPEHIRTHAKQLVSAAFDA